MVLQRGDSAHGIGLRGVEISSACRPFQCVSNFAKSRSNSDRPSGPSEGIWINNKVIKADIAADNGVIHLINRVLLP
jgi:hypothetical protein